MSRSRTLFTLGFVILLGGFGGAALRPGPDVFDHEQHRKVFPECLGCHAGVTEPGRPLYPAPEACAVCHDGSVEKKVDWSAPPARPSNFRFAHAEHSRKSEIGRASCRERV